MIRKKKLAVLCGEQFAEDIQQYAEKHDICTISVRKRQDALIHRFSDEQWYLNSTDSEQLLPMLREHHVDGILACAGEKLLRKCVGWICESGFRFYSTPEQWRVLTDKQQFREYASKFGIPLAKLFRVDPVLCSPLEQIVYPVIIKPVDNSGSSGIRICYDEEQLASAVSFALEHSERKEVLCESYLKGRFFQFEVWMQNGTAYFPYTKDRCFYSCVSDAPPQPFLDVYPSADQSVLEELLFGRIQQMLFSLGIKNGSCMFQGILSEGVPYIIDSAFRLSGGMDFRIVKAEKQVDLIGAHIEYAVNGVFSGDFLPLTRPFRSAYATLCIGLKNGIIAEISGLEEIRRLPFVVSCIQHYPVGYEMRNYGTFAQTAFRLSVKAENRRQLKKCVEEILQLLSVQNSQGESMLADIPVYSV